MLTFPASPALKAAGGSVICEAAIGGNRVPIQKQLGYWGILAAALMLALWWLGPVITPFVLGAALAYLLDPVADRLERLGMSRVVSVVIITLLALVTIALLGLLLLPLLVQQTVQLIATLPSMTRSSQDWLYESVPFISENEGLIREELQNLATLLKDKSGEVMGLVLSSVAGLVNMVVLLVIVPVVTFYLLLDWDRMIARIDALLPRDHAETLRHLGREIDRTLASFIRGQGLVCLIQGTFYAVTLTLAGLSFGLAIGAFAGLITFIPYVGSFVGGTLAIGFALFQFWGDWIRIALIAGIFLAGQFLEGNILTPKLVGSSVGLHPVWLIFALSVFGSLFGFVGMLVAVPVAAVIGVLTRHAIDRYQASALYLGTSPESGAEPGEQGHDGE